MTAEDASRLWRGASGAVPARPANGTAGRAGGRVPIGSAKRGPLTHKKLRILQVNTHDIYGGAAKIAMGLFRGYREQGQASWLAVKEKGSDDPQVLLISNHKGLLRGTERTKSLLGIPSGDSPQRSLGLPRLLGLWSWFQGTHAWLARRFGYEYWNYPESSKLLSLIPGGVDILHCHNLHGEYFDLGALARFSQRLPTFLTLHDLWLLRGQCQSMLHCENCSAKSKGFLRGSFLGSLIFRDAAAYNCRKRQALYQDSQLYVATPSEGLMRQVEKSILAPAVKEARVIPNGVDLNVFRPHKKSQARAALGISENVKALVFVAVDLRTNVAKDYETVKSAVRLAAERMSGQELILFVLGEKAAEERVGRAVIRFVPFLQDSHQVAQYYQMADVYVHAAELEVWGLAVTEALACGIPVVATATGGIPEQIQDGVTGFLVPPKDATTMAEKITKLLQDEKLYERMSSEAVQHARRNFNLQDMVRRYLEWYDEILYARRRASEDFREDRNRILLDATLNAGRGIPF